MVSFDNIKILKCISPDKEIEKELNNIKTCYVSTNQEYWLFTDIVSFQYIKEKYEFDKKVECYIVISIEEYLEEYCIENNKEVKVLEKYYDLEENIQNIDILFDKNNIKEWDRILINNLEELMIKNIADDINCAIKELKNDGYNISVILNTLNNNNV